MNAGLGHEDAKGGEEVKTYLVKMLLISNP